MRAPFGKRYVRVKFHGTRHWYTYYCPGCRVGDFVIVPANWYVRHKQLVRVRALGRRWPFRVAKAQRA